MFRITRPLCFLLTALTLSGALAGCNKADPAPTPSVTPVASTTIDVATPEPATPEPGPTSTSPEASPSASNKVEYPGDRGTSYPTPTSSGGVETVQPATLPFEPSASAGTSEPGVPSSPASPSASPEATNAGEPTASVQLQWRDLGGGIESACDSVNHNLLYRDKASGQLTVLKGGC